MKFTPGLWRHTTRKTTFTLYVDNFGVIYLSRDDALHLVNAVKYQYQCTVDWTGSLYCGLNLESHYGKVFVKVTMKDYVRRALAKFKHVPSKKLQHSPHPWHAPVHGSKTAQQPTSQITAPLLDKFGTRRIQAISSTFLHHSEINTCINAVFNEIVTKKCAPTEDTNQKFQMLMGYLHQYLDGTLRYYTSDMILLCEADSSHFVLPKDQSHTAAWFTLSNNPNKHDKVMYNAQIYIICLTIKNITASAAECKTGGTFMTVQHACTILVTLIEFGIT